MISQDRDLVLAALTVQGISAYGRLLLVVLILTGDDTSSGRTTAGSKRDLAKIVGVSRRTVSRSIHELEQAGLLARCLRYRDDGGSAASVYTVFTDFLIPEEPR